MKQREEIDRRAERRRPQPGTPKKALFKYINRSAPCLLAHRAFFEGGGAGIFKSLHFTYLPEVCLYDDLPIANLEPGVSAEELLTSFGTLCSGWLLVSALFMPLDFCIEFCIDFRLDFGWKT